MAERCDTTLTKDDPELRARQRMELVRRTICPKGIGEDEFALFWEQCQRSGLDPLLKEAYCVPRRVNTGSTEKPNWVTRHEFQPSEAGMLARAERFPEYEGITAAEVYADDPITIDYGTGDVQHKVNPAQRKGLLVGAWARVQRRGKVPTVVWVRFDAMVQKTPLWAKMPDTMVRKCAKVAALRTAFPEAFGGLYIREEMPPEEFATEEPEEKPKARRRERGSEVVEAMPSRPALPPPDPLTETQRQEVADMFANTPRPATLKEAEQQAKQRLETFRKGEDAWSGVMAEATTLPPVTDELARATEAVRGKPHPMEVIPIGKAAGKRIDSLDKPQLERMFLDTDAWLANAKNAKHKDRATMQAVWDALGARLEELNHNEEAAP
jgi:phage recombination protein Bet